jgi:ATP-dependent Clp protease ATP-binding subunit ClpC
MNDPSEEADHERIDEALKNTFRPEFLNRIDEIIIFEQLTKDDVVEIVDLQMQEVRSRLDDHDLKIALTMAAKEWLAEQGYDEDFGARPLKRALQRYVESPLSVKLLQGEFAKGDHVLVDAEDKKLVFSHYDEAVMKDEEDAPAVEEVAAG